MNEYSECCEWMHAVNAMNGCMQWMQWMDNVVNGWMKTVNAVNGCMQWMQWMDACSECNEWMNVVNGWMKTATAVNGCMQWMQWMDACSEFNKLMNPKNAVNGWMQWMDEWSERCGWIDIKTKNEWIYALINARIKERTNERMDKRHEMNALIQNECLPFLFSILVRQPLLHGPDLNGLQLSLARELALIKILFNLLLQGNLP